MGVTDGNDRLGSALLLSEPVSKGFSVTQSRKATLHRMVLPDHTCPFGVRAKQLLQSEGYEVDDRILRSREEVEAFKTEHGIATTPLIVIDSKTIGGSDDLERYLAG